MLWTTSSRDGPAVTSTTRSAMIAELPQPGYLINVVEGLQPLDPENDNVDVEVCFPDGRRYGATCFTSANSTTMMERHHISRESDGGRYFWCADMLIIRSLRHADIAATIADLIARGELQSVFARLDTELD